MRLIDADALMEKVCENCHENYCIPDATDTVYGCELAESINQMPTVEPERKRDISIYATVLSAAQSAASVSVSDTQTIADIAGQNWRLNDNG